MNYESKFQTIFSNWNQSRKEPLIGAFELKDTRGKKYLPYNSFEDHQIPSLLAGQINGYKYKISDADPRLKPCDYLSTPPLKAYIVINFVKTFYVIELDKFIEHRDKSTGKHIDENECRTLSTVSVGH